ncbi:hypothetical protein ACOMHN_065335 [Nucella lapillus]
MGGAASQADDTLMYAGFDVSRLPEELFVQMLVFVPAPDLVKRCSLVCKHWMRVTRDQSLWRRKCEQEGKYLPGIMGPPPDNFILYYFLNPYTRNLLKNTHAGSLAHWQLSDPQWIELETTPAGADPIANHVPAEEIGGQKVQNWVTSYQPGSMSQTVRLLEEGCYPTCLDDFRPPIHVSAWCAARWDCGARFELRVRLLDERGEELHSEQTEKDLADSALRRVWHKVELTLADYKPGVRGVEVVMSGVDTQYWAGSYGSKFTLPSVRFLFDKKKQG